MAKRTAETRWFFDAPPVSCEAFFGGAVPSVERVDWYAFPCHQHSGVKFREGRLETKLLIEDYGPQTWGSVTGNVESWTKWSVEYVGELPDDTVLAATGWVAVHKCRHWRVLALPKDNASGGSAQWQDQRVENGCEVEWSVVTVDGTKWWTVGFEAVGDVSDLNENLRRAMEHVFGQTAASEIDLTRFTLENSLAYPCWLWKVKTGGGMLRYDC